MIGLIFLALAAILSFAALILWLAVRVVQLNGLPEKVEQLEREVDRLGGRTTSLEKRYVAHQATSPPPVEAVRAQESAPPQADVIRPRLRTQTPLPVTEAVAPADPVSAYQTPPVAPVLRAPIAPAPVPVQPAMRPVVPQLVANAEIPARADSATAKRSASLEERLGQNWLNKIGIVTLVTGLALFLGYQLRTLGPLGKSLMGLLLSAAILVTGLFLERRERYRIFARAAIGGGWALLYFVAFALFHLPAMQVLHSQAADLVLMSCVATAMIAHSLRYRSQVVTSLAFLLASFTLTISHVTMFSLVAGALLAAGLVTVSFRQRWFVMVLGGLVAVYLNHFLWLQRMLPDGAQAGHAFPEFLPSAILLLFYWLLFRVFYIFKVPENESDRFCSGLNAVLNSVGVLALLKYQSSHPEWAFRGLLAIGTAELVLAFMARRRHHNAFVVLASIASALLLAATPFHFASSSWSMMWVLQAEVLFVTGLALKESVFRRLGVLSFFAAVIHLLGTGAMPIFDLRQSSPDPNRHAVLSVAFVSAALIGWFNAELVSRRWRHLFEQDIDHYAMKITSYMAGLCAGVAAWLFFAGTWTIVPWLALSLLLAFASDRLQSRDLALQADLLSIAAITRAAIINFTRWEDFASAPRVAIMLVAIAMLYVLMRRRQASHVLSATAIEPVYSWAAAGLAAVLAWYALQPAAVSLAWALMGTVLLETGFVTRKPLFRHQSIPLLIASFIRVYFINIGLASTPRMYTMLPLAAMFAWTYQRLQGAEQADRNEQLFGKVSAWLATAITATLLYFSLRPEWVAIGGALLAVSLLLLARVLRRPLFTAQAIVLALLASARAIGFNMFSPAPLAHGSFDGRVFTVGITCAALLGVLPVAFSIRRQQREQGEGSWLQKVLRRPEQWLFFAPLAMLFSLIFVQLRAGMITVGWSALGLCAFLFALTVGERSYRLAGLGLLLLGVGKIITVDIWNASPTDRYITLIVIGGALLLVSFLYSRFRETILELL